MGNEINRWTETGEFITKPGDKFIILSNPKVLVSNINVQVVNDRTGEDFFIEFSNFDGSWEFLRELDNMGGREVWHKLGNNEPIPFKQTMVFEQRFMK